MPKQVSRTRRRRLDRLHRCHSIVHHKSKLLRTAPVWAYPEVSAEDHLYTRRYRLAKVLQVLLAYCAIMLQKVERDRSLPTCFLDALFVVNVHIQVRAVFLRQRDSLVIDQRRVLHLRHSCSDCILNALSTVCVCLHTQAECVSFLHCSLQLFQSEFRGNRAAAVGEYAAG